MGDIALIKFDKPFDSSKWGTDSNKNRPNPVCLPSSSFQDEGSEGFVLGLGFEFQKTCRTNGAGPERYEQCAPGKILFPLILAILRTFKNNVFHLGPSFLIPPFFLGHSV